VRLASELRTTFTAIENELRGKHGTWLSIGAALGLAFALALVTALLRHKPHRPPPELPTAKLLHAPSPPPMPVARTPEIADAGAQAEGRPLVSAPRALAGSETHDAASRAAEPGARPQTKRLPALGSVDGTPLFTEPGF
jgi:hypothetical protein